MNNDFIYIILLIMSIYLSPVSPMNGKDILINYINEFNSWGNGSVQSLFTHSTGSEALSKLFTRKQLINYMEKIRCNCELRTAGSIFKGAIKSLHLHYNRIRPIFYGTGERVPLVEMIASSTLTALLIWGLRRSVRRFRTATDIPFSYIKKGTPLKGYVVSVNDSDNLRFYHANTFTLRLPKVKKSDIKEQTINIRLAGIDAPEMGHFGGIGQPFAKEAKIWLEKYTIGHKVEIIPHRLDQYARLVASVYIRKWIFFKYNVSLEMTKAGYACVYDSSGAEYGGLEKKLRKAEQKARRSRVGMWVNGSKEWTSPADYKKSRKLIQNT